MLSRKQRKTTKKACKRHQNLSKKEKQKKLQHGCEHYKNLSENEKQKLVEYRKKILKLQESILIQKNLLLHEGK